MSNKDQAQSKQPEPKAVDLKAADLKAKKDPKGGAVQAVRAAARPGFSG